MQDSRKVRNIACREFQILKCIQWRFVGLTWAQVLTEFRITFRVSVFSELGDDYEFTNQ